MMYDEVLKVQQMNVSYGKRRIIENVSFSLACGELTALLGLNGSGKTTLLKSVSGLLKADSGSCMIKGEDCFRMEEKNRASHISYIPQKNGIIFDISVMNVVLMGFNPSLRLLEVPGKKEKQIALSILQKFKMDPFTDESFLCLSEGQKQMVILARAVAQNAPIMLFDEPDSALDFINRNMVLGKIREIVKKDLRSGLISMQSPNFALEYCDKMILLSNGSICDILSVHSTDRGTLQRALSRIYGNIEIIDYKGLNVMVRCRRESLDEERL